jgi:uncharacterized protein
MGSGMEFSFQGKVALQAPLRQLWSFLLDSDTLPSCIPGAENIERIDEKTYKGIVKQSVGPIRGRFEFTAVLAEVDPPYYIKTVGRASDKGVVGTIVQETMVTLNEITTGEVEISYTTKVNVFGGLPIIGRLIMEAKAKSMEKQFTDNLREKVREKLGEVSLASQM